MTRIEPNPVGDHRGRVASWRSSPPDDQESRHELAQSPCAKPETPELDPGESNVCDQEGCETETDEKDLVQRMLAGDEAAMNHFADEYFPRLFRFASARLAGNRELARDLVQTTVCKALEKLASFRGEAGLFTWLCTCCRNEIAMHFRRLGRRPDEVELEEGREADTDLAAFPAGFPLAQRPVGAHRRMESKETGNRVHAALDLLPSRYSQALEWKYVEHISVREIADRWKVGPKAAESVLTRARNAFRQGYERLAADELATAGKAGTS